MSSDTDQNHKVLNLYREQIVADENAKEAVKSELGRDDVTKGEVVLELARAILDLRQCRSL